MKKISRKSISVKTPQKKPLKQAKVISSSPVAKIIKLSPKKTAKKVKKLVKNSKKIAPKSLKKVAKKVVLPIKAILSPKKSSITSKNTVSNLSSKVKKSAKSPNARKSNIKTSAKNVARRTISPKKEMVIVIDNNSRSKSRGNKKIVNSPKNVVKTEIPKKETKKKQEIKQESPSRSRSNTPVTNTKKQGKAIKSKSPVKAVKVVMSPKKEVKPSKSKGKTSRSKTPVSKSPVRKSIQVDSPIKQTKAKATRSKTPEKKIQSSKDKQAELDQQQKVLEMKLKGIKSEKLRLESANKEVLSPLKLSKPKNRNVAKPLSPVKSNVKSNIIQKTPSQLKNLKSVQSDVIIQTPSVEKHNIPLSSSKSKDKSQILETPRSVKKSSVKPKEFETPANIQHVKSSVKSSVKDKKFETPAVVPPKSVKSKEINQTPIISQLRESSVNSRGKKSPIETKITVQKEFKDIVQNIEMINKKKEEKLVKSVSKPKVYVNVVEKNVPQKKIAAQSSTYKQASPKISENKQLFDKQYKKYINLSDVNKKKNNITSLEILLSIIEVAQHGQHYNIENSSRSKQFWRKVSELKFCENIFNSYRPETIRKYWRFINERQVENVIAVIKRIKDFKEDYNVKYFYI